MEGATLKAHTSVILERNRFGQFAAAAEAGARSTVEETVKRGASMSRAMAPVGGKGRASYSRKPGYVPLKKSIRTHVSGTRGYWYSVAPHAPYVEQGTRPHWIDGPLVFFYPGSPGEPKNWFVYDKPGFNNYTAKGARVWHPGTDAQPFLEPAYDRVVRRQMLDIAKRNFPG